MSRRRIPSAANDNGATPQIRVELPQSPPLTDAEVEIFDALISNIGELTAANEDERSLPREKSP